MAKVYNVRQGADDIPVACLVCLLEAFHQYTPYDLQVEESTQMMMFALINQAAPNIRKILQSLERLGGKHIRELVVAKKKVYNKREMKEQKGKKQV